MAQSLTPAVSNVGPPSHQEGAKNQRRPEFTRTTIFSTPDTSARTTTSTPHQAQQVSWSGPVQPLLGYSLQELEDSEAWWLDHVHPEDAGHVFEKLTKHLKQFSERKECAEARMWNVDYRLRRKDSTYVLVSERGITTRDEAGFPLILKSVIFDKELQRRSRVEHKKHMEARNYLAAVAENTPSGIFLMDNQGYAIYMNKAAEEITGFKFEELFDFTFHASCHSCHRDGRPYPLVECPVFRCQQQNTSCQNQPEVFVHADGHFYDIVYSVSPIGGDYGSSGAVIEFRDVTELRKMERERLDAVLENQQKSIVLQQSLNHKEAMSSFVSFICHELRNPLQGITASAEFLLESMKDLQALADEMSQSQNNATQTPNAVSQMGALTLSDAKSQPNGNGSAAHEESVAAKLNKILQNTQQLIANVQTCADHQSLIINNTLDLSRLEAGKVEPSLEVLDVLMLGRQTISMMRAKALAKSINLSMTDPQQLPLYLKADSTMLTQVLLNLMSNALKFTPLNGSIALDLHTAPHPTDSGKVILHGSVTDTGLGMTAEEKGRIFQKFTQANRKVAQVYGGSGLGLSICKELVQIMGGEIHVDSIKGQGSTFRFTTTHDILNELDMKDFLRLSRSGASTPASEVSEPRSDTFTHGAAITKGDFFPGLSLHKFKMIGVAEDNPINLNYLSKVLRALGYEHFCCENGQDLLTRYLDATETPLDACIIDIHMPICDGLEATRLIRQIESTRALQGLKRAAMPIIALSGNALTEQVKEAFEAGVSDYLLKPTKKADLVKTLTYWEGIISAGEEHLPMSSTTRAVARLAQVKPAKANSLVT